MDLALVSNCCKRFSSFRIFLLFASFSESSEEVDAGLRLDTEAVGGVVDLSGCSMMHVPLNVLHFKQTLCAFSLG